MTYACYNRILYGTACCPLAQASCTSQDVAFTGSIRLGSASPEARIDAVALCAVTTTLPVHWFR